MGTVYPIRELTQKEYTEWMSSIDEDGNPLPEPPKSKAHTFLARLQELSDENVQTAIRKNGDYANPEDPFANFRDCEALGVSIERGILVRMSDKMRRVSNLLDKEPLVTDESIADTLSDLANYALILRIYLESK